MYGNVASGDPYDNGDGSHPIPKKLWVAAIDLHPTPGKDPSHPAFYLPDKSSTRATCAGTGWSIRASRTARHARRATSVAAASAGARATAARRVQRRAQGCAQEFEKCTNDGDCCGANEGTRA